MKITSIVKTTLTALLLTQLSGCLLNDPVDEPTIAAAPIPPAATNQAPTISGQPPVTVTAGLEYDFAPVASDPDGDSLVFAISNQPAWATFSTSTGRLSGVPTASEVGMFSNVGIQVSDGELADSLDDFSIEVLSSGAPPPTSTEYAGFGSITKGHESCPNPYELYQVSSLSGGSGPGTLRDAVSQGCRHIVSTLVGRSIWATCKLAKAT